MTDSGFPFSAAFDLGSGRARVIEVAIAPTEAPRGGIAPRARSLPRGSGGQLRSAARAASGGRQSICRAGKIEEASGRSAHAYKGRGRAPTVGQKGALKRLFPYKTVLLRRNLVSAYL